MSRFTRNEVLWIVRGMRLGKFLKRLGEGFQHRHNGIRGAAAETTPPPSGPAPVPRAPAANRALEAILPEEKPKAPNACEKPRAPKHIATTVDAAAPEALRRHVSKYPRDSLTDY